MKHILRSIAILIGLGFISSFIISDNKEEHGPVNWITFQEAVKKCKTKPKPILIDIYTTWCGPCKMLSKNTFGNEKIAKYMNENFYCVKFDAEMRDTVKFTMMIPDTLRDKNNAIKKIGEKPQEYVFVNPYPATVSRTTHQFAASILQGYQIAFPSVVFLSKEVKRLDVLQGYFPPEQFEPIVKFYGSESYDKIKWEEYQKTFKSELSTR
jgi:thioredoxin-related protein